MKIGMPTLIELESLEENVQLCKALNLDFLEINMNFPQFQLDKLDANVLNKLKEEYGIFFTFHLAEDIDVGHMNKNIRNTYVGEALNILTFMKSIESKILNMHMSKGIYVTLPAEKVFIYEKYEEEFLSHIQTFSNRISEVIGDDDQTVFIENTGIGNIQYIRKAISQLLLNSNFKLTWDIGHDHASGLKDCEFWEEHKTHIQHFHIHDAIKESNHLTLYDGEIDIDEYLKMAEQSNATVVLETKTIEALRESVKRLNQRTHYMDKHSGDDIMIHYYDTLAHITPENLNGFFVNWPNPPSKTKHFELLEKSAYRWIAVDDQTGNVVGFITAISDQVLAAYIPLLEVLPEYQGLGIGKQLVENMLSTLSEYYMVDLLCDPELQDYYATFNMHKTQGMLFRNYEKQNGR